MAMSDEESARARTYDEHAAHEHQVRHAERMAAELRRHNERFHAAVHAGPRDRVLDIGCGTGVTTRDAARAAVAGRVVGVDLSAPVLERARQLSEEEGLHNVTYLSADAQVHRFPSQHFDLCISRFGVMFFTDPVAAFTNIGRALRPGARLVLMVWQDRERNEWYREIRRSLIVDAAAPAPPVSGQDPFSLADPAITEGILAAPGFAEIAFTDVDEPVYYGPNTAAAYDFVLGLRLTNELLANLGAATAEQALQRLRATLAEHGTSNGVYFGSRSWIITARRRLSNPAPPDGALRGQSDR
jgi:ubiquinone/menaquinone biosynthesis C-methylase UbiE